MSLQRIWMPSPNKSSRGGQQVRLIVLHTAEGARTIESLGNFFASSSSQVSSHAGADDKINTIGEYVARGDKAWTQANANPYSVAIELCAFAAWSIDEWNRHQNMLANCAQWIAEEAAAFGIPIVRLNASQAQGGGRGVCQHSDLGALGGGHHDCGPSFPMDHVLQMAAGGVPAPEPPPPPPEPEDKDVANYVICAAENSGEQYITDLVTSKTPILDEADFNATLVNLRAAGATVRETGVNTPIRVPPKTLSKLPTIKP
jgi:hypothetical protein